MRINWLLLEILTIEARAPRDFNTSSGYTESTKHTVEQAPKLFHYVLAHL